MARTSKTWCSCFWRLCSCYCCHALFDPLLIIYAVTFIVNIAVAVTCLCIWTILFMNVSIQLYVAAEEAYHNLNDYDVHTVVTLALVPTILLYWTLVMWCILSHLFEWLVLMWSLPRIRQTLRQSRSDSELTRTAAPELARPADYLPAGTDVELADQVEDSQLDDADIAPVSTQPGQPSIEKANRLHRKALVMEREAQRADDIRHTSLAALSTASTEALKTAVATKAQIDLLKPQLSEEQQCLLPTDDEVDALIERTTKLAAHAQALNRPKYWCAWSDHMVASPFSSTWTAAWLPMLEGVVGMALVAEIVILAGSYAAGALNQFQATVLLTVFTGVLLMLWSILDAAEQCSRAFWWSWCYFAGCAVISALCCLVENDWPNQFVTTAVIVYVAVMFAISSVFALHEVWLVPMHDFWLWVGTTVKCEVCYYLGMCLFWLGSAAFLAAFFVYEFGDDEGGAYLRTAFQILWTLPAFLLVCRSLFIPRTPRGAEVGNISAYGPLTRGDWSYLVRLIFLGYFVLLIGVFGGAWSGERSGVYSALVYLAGPVLLVCASVLILAVLHRCGADRLRHYGWSYPAAIKPVVSESSGLSASARAYYELMLRLYDEQVLALWAWDMFRVYTLCVLVGLIILASYARMGAILLFMVMVVLHGYVLIEHHFYGPMRSEITMGGSVFATLANPRRRMYRLVLLFLFLCIVLVTLAATWSLTTSYHRVDAEIRPHNDELQVAPNAVPYAICNGQSFNTLDVVDLAFMAELSYFKDPIDVSVDCGMDDPANLQTCLGNYFTAGYTKASTGGLPYNWQVLELSVPVEASQSNRPSYYVVRSTAANLIVVAVRGSITGRDWLEDFNLYAESCMLQLFSLVVPMTYVWPYEATASMVKAFSFTQKFVYTTNADHIASDYYYKHILDVTQGLQTQFPTSDIMLVGHSLGGAVAQIVAARMGLRGFAFNSPGTLFSRKKFGIPGDLQRLADSQVTIVRENDAVVYVDQHTGMIQQISCDSSFISSYCHSIHPISCHLIAHCGALDRPTFDHWGGGLAYCTAN